MWSARHHNRSSGRDGGKHQIADRIRLEPTPEGRLTLVAFTQRVIAPGLMIKADEAMELRHHALPSRSGTVRLLPGRVHVPVRLPHVEEPGLLLHLVLQQCVSTVPHPINYTRDSPRRDKTVDVETEGEPDSSRGSLP